MSNSSMIASILIIALGVGPLGHAHSSRPDSRRRSHNLKPVTVTAKPLGSYGLSVA